MPQPRRTYGRQINTAKRPKPTPQRLMPLIGIAWDDPDRRAILQQLLFAEADGEDLYDRHVLARCVIGGRIAAAEKTAQIEAAEAQHWVYYMQVGPYIKIGTTTDIKARTRAYPPGSKLLAVEHGHTRKEQQRHREFREYLAEFNEWFHPGERLMAHIRALHDTEQLTALVAARLVGKVKRAQ